MRLIRTIHSCPPRYAQNLIEKIVQRYSVDGLEKPDVELHSGDYINLKPSYCMSHDNTWPIALKFLQLQSEKLYDANQIVNTIDHDVQNKSEANLQKYDNMRKLAGRLGSHFYPAGRGIGHQIMIEEGFAFPYRLAVASDSHSPIYGGVGCLGVSVVRSDAACIWATGRTWWRIPPVAKVELKGQLPRGLSGKDVIIALCGIFKKDEVLNHAIEFTGEGVGSLSIDDRLSIANMCTEWGALAGLFPVDRRTVEYYRGRLGDVEASHPRINKESVSQVESRMATMVGDVDASYNKTLQIDLSRLTHYVAGPNSVKVMECADKLSRQEIAVNKAYLISCTNSRLSDLQNAAEVFKRSGRQVASGVQFYLAAASSIVQRQAELDGSWKVLVDAGAIVLPSGCGPCIGLGMGLLKEGEVGVSSSNRNFKGRMGDVKARAYLSSPAVVAASAILGKIGTPEEVFGEPREISGDLSGDLSAECVENAKSGMPPQPKMPPQGEVIEGFPERIQGRIVFCNNDNINTDGIYPGKYTYNENITRQEMGEIVMENYDTEFTKIAQAGDILVSGYNFGSGSSREQAAVALLAKGIPLVVAGSFSNIFCRNAINNVLLTLDVPELVEYLKEKYKGDARLTIRSDLKLTWDIRDGVVDISENDKVVFSKKVNALGRIVQEIAVQGGLEGWIRNEIAR
ncbi:hypothetical protein TBLA_0A01460 [Henningerozyma blattae CBS 6284]|uniref:Homoaconitase, mitochondrial n=1 Tax=Henningerozyma blattae (strain ATCC 34711 / CBS 6284 / DSM 70876 / NBRC 10599 / NRRL Y-10934 / UCD 77-7) TaxID=1071380 RepID=I2GUZ3_HENB6|nr:hypothetical protein TBLA_0A01460 [Tetrapisispora blattae CBS 6284]CCH57945.1 hypothetical protein TBLA_0A01460 [Tetrapisispora blattae CBS 6284]